MNYPVCVNITSLQWKKNQKILISDSHKYKLV